METTKKSRVNLSFNVVGSQDVAASGRKSPIIFLHGVTSAKDTWREVIRPIAAATCRKAYAYDARNHGDSGWSDDFDYDLLRDDLLEFMDGIHAKKSVLVGHSMGGKTAMLFAASEPGRVEKLVVEDISPKPSTQREKVQKYFQLLEYIVKNIPAGIKDLNEAKEYIQRFLEGKIQENQRSTRHGSTDGSSLPLYQDESGKFCWKTNLKAIENKFLSAPSKSMPDGVYPGPTLMLYGTKSPYTASGDKEFVRPLFPNCKFTAVEGASHQIHLEYQDIFVKEVVEFLNAS